MGFFTSERARRDGHVTVTQLLGAVLMFVAFSVIGGFLIAGIALPAVTVAGSAATGSAELFQELPEELEEVQLPQQSNIYARDGRTLLATFYDQNRVVVPLEEISPWLQMAVVAIEDKRFWEHNGVDGEGLLRAGYVTLTSDGTQGASTLTQQLVKNTLLQEALAIDELEARETAMAAATEVSMPRKIREWRLALALEENLNQRLGTDCEAAPEVDCGKEEILQQYLNIAQFGINIYGAETAAQYYFSKPAAELNALEAATIAGITQNPSRWDPTRTFDEGADNYENATYRRNVVLGVMFEQEMLSRAEYDEYRATPLEETLNVSYPKQSCSAAADAPFFCDYVTKIIRHHEVFNTDGKDGRKLLYRGGLDIVTTLDISQQRIANEELRNSLPEDDPNGFAMAMVGLDPSTGQILSMAQNRDFDPAAEAPNSTSINYTVDRQWGGSRGFSPGSTFKPVILAEWLNSGHSLNQVVSGSITTYTSENWHPACTGPVLVNDRWRPANVGGVGSGQTSVLAASASSINTAYVAMTSQMDLCDVASMAETLGFERADGADFEIIPSIALGTQNASPLGMASTMQTFANRGVHCEPYAILSITDANGEDVEVPEENCRQVISEELADGVGWSMQEVMKTGSGRTVQLAGGRPSAGKTGTSQQNAHTWFVGYVPQLLSVFWLGHPDRDVPQQSITFNGTRYSYVYGSTIAAPTWKRFMDRSLEGVESASLPGVTDDMLYGVPVRIPDLSGMTESQARYALNNAGFRLSVSSTPVFSNQVAAGSIASQSPGAGAMMRPGATVTVNVATDSLPGWWTDWPQGWDRNVAPDDYWGSTWPPPEFANNPPRGWVEQCGPGDDFNEDTGQWCPGSGDDDGRGPGRGSGRGGDD